MLDSAVKLSSLYKNTANIVQFVMREQQLAYYHNYSLL